MARRSALIAALFLALSANAQVETPGGVEQSDKSVALMAAPFSATSPYIAFSSSPHLAPWFAWSSDASELIWQTTPYALTGCVGNRCPLSYVIRNAGDDGTNQGVVNLSIDGSFMSDIATLGNAVNIGQAITPFTITANQNDYVPSNGAPFCAYGFWRLASDASRTITGIDATVCSTNYILESMGHALALSNVGSFNLILANESTSSVAGNRFHLLADYTLAPGATIRLVRDHVLHRWVGIGSYDAGSVASLPSGGAGNFAEVLVDFGAAGSDLANTVVTGQAWVTSSSKILCAPTLTSTADRIEGAEDAVIEGLIGAVHTRVAGTGFTLTVGPRMGIAVGKYNFHCTGA